MSSRVPICLTSVYDEQCLEQHDVSDTIGTLALQSSDHLRVHYMHAGISGPTRLYNLLCTMPFQSAACIRDRPARLIDYP